MHGSRERKRAPKWFRFCCYTNEDEIGKPRIEVNPFAIFAVFMIAVCGMLLFRTTEERRLEISPFPHYSRMLSSTLPTRQTTKTPQEIAETGLIVDGQVTLIGTVFVFQVLDAMFQMTMAAIRHDFPCVAGVHFGTAANVTLFRFPQKQTLAQQLASFNAKIEPNATCVTRECEKYMYTIKEVAAQSHSFVPANETYLTEDQSLFLFMLNAACVPIVNEANPAMSFMVSTETSHLCRSANGIPQTQTRTRTRLVRCRGKVVHPKDPNITEGTVEVLTEGRTSSCVHNVMDLTKPSIGTEIGLQGVCVPAIQTPLTSQEPRATEP